jgi:hypothetical protein
MVLRPLEERPERRLINRSDVSEAVGHEPAARHPGALVGHDAFVEQSRGLFAVCDHERLRVAGRHQQLVDRPDTSPTEYRISGLREDFLEVGLVRG